MHEVRIISKDGSDIKYGINISINGDRITGNMISNKIVLCDVGKLCVATTSGILGV